MSWSPDGKSLAFWVTLEPAPYTPEPNTYYNERLAILNTETLGITVYCISGDNFGYKGIPSVQFTTFGIPAPVWSPDGKQVVVENRYDADASRLILLDIPTGKAVQFGADMEPTGWMLAK